MTQARMSELVAEGRSSGEMSAHIARVAARLFAERGYDATSVREIVEAAGVTKPTLYYHFGSKQGLGEALLTRPMAGLLTTLEGLLAGEADPVRLLRGMLEAQFAFFRDEPDRARFFFAIGFGPNSTSLQEEMHRFGGAIRATIGLAVRRLADAGVIEPGRVDDLAEACKGLVIVTTLDSIFCGRKLDPDLAGRLVADLLMGFARPDFRSKILDKGLES